MRFASILFIAIAGLAGCADPGAEPQTSVESHEIVTPTCDCGSVVVTPWTRAITSYWQSGATTMTLVLHPAAAVEGEAPKFYAWFVANGSQVKVIYSVLRSDASFFFSAVTGSFTSAASVPGSSRFWGIAGGIDPGPGPIGPGPNGDPEVFSASDVGRVLRTAGTIVDSTKATLDYHSTIVFTPAL
jgi:hypothetical protein